MASITIRNLEDHVKEKLRVRAAERGRSMEAEARELLRRALDTRSDGPKRSLGDVMREVREQIGDDGFDITPYLPKREPGREPPDFS